MAEASFKTCDLMIARRKVGYSQQKHRKLQLHKKAAQNLFPTNCFVQVLPNLPTINKDNMHCRKYFPHNKAAKTSGKPLHKTNFKVRLAGV